LPAFPLTIGQCVALACQWEATAPKVGNVHRGADFDDVTFSDFLTSAAIIAPLLDRAADVSLGDTVYNCIAATQKVVSTNTNLGLVLSLVPLAMVRREEAWEAGLGRVWSQLSPRDAEQVYAAIRLARPGGLGTAAQMDVHDLPPDDLLAAMRLAADRDLIARQYATNFALVRDEIVPGLVQRREAGDALTSAIIRVHVELLAEQGDTLIRRKAGDATERQARELARWCLDAAAQGEEAWLNALSDYDFWLRADGRRRNPGATADLIAAGLFVLFRDSLWPPPWR
jgi:triphosphoribosyl-dephospho-CoA synthase